MQRSTEFRLRFRFRRRMWINGHFRRTFGFGRKQSYHIRCTFGFGRLQLVNSVVAESRTQSLSCGDQCAPDAENHQPHCVLTIPRKRLCCLRLHLALWGLVAVSLTRRTADMMGLNVKDIRFTGQLGNGHWAGLAGFCSRVGSDTIDFRFQFRFSAESPSLLSVAHTVSAEYDTSLSTSIYMCFQLVQKSTTSDDL